MKNNYNTTISLLCATCGGSDFDFNEDKTYVKCTKCNREYLGGYDELVSFNQRIIKKEIDIKAEEIRNDLMKDIHNAFKGNKNFRIK